MENETILDMLKAGGDFDIQTYKVGTGGQTRVNIQPRINYSGDAALTTGHVIGDFFGGLMVAGVAAFVVAMIVMIAVAVSTDGTPNAGVSGHLVSTCFYSWLVVTILGGVVAVVYDLSKMS